MLQGGIVAKAIFCEADFDPSSVDTIITLATPHQHPVLAIDEHISKFYRRVNSLWTGLSNKTNSVAFASIGGADRDIQVRSGLTAIARHPSINVLVQQIYLSKFSQSLTI